MGFKCGIAIASQECDRSQRGRNYVEKNVDRIMRYLDSRVLLIYSGRQIGDVTGGPTHAAARGIRIRSKLESGFNDAGEIAGGNK